MIKMSIKAKILHNFTCIVLMIQASADNLEKINTSNKKFDIEHYILVNKCCEKFEIQVDGVCSQVNETDYFNPLFTSYSGNQNLQLRYKFVIGLPNCGSMQTWPIYHDMGSSDKLVLLEDGKLRHYTSVDTTDDYEDGQVFHEDRSQLFHDYINGQYCLDKALTSGENIHKLYASICFPKTEIRWSDSGFLVRKLLNPIFHGLSLIILLVIAIVYFILPTLRDLVGNLITTISICLMIAQAADLTRIFTEFTNHISFIVVDIVLYFSLLSAFLWLNSLGYYIWKTFRSRNVFLRVTDGRKYCYYSAFIWSVTLLFASCAVFSHFYLDARTYKNQNVIANQETMGWLGMIVFFSPVACSIIIDIFFFVTTLKLINRRNVYGRIQHKLKSNFIMFSFMLLIMSISWIFLIFSLFGYDGFLYAHILVNGLQMPLLFYVCVVRQKHVIYLLKKSCCYNEPPSSNDWGDEMRHINSNDY